MALAYNTYFLIAFVLGLLWGSFVLAVADRFSNPKTIIKGRSHCPKCKKKIAPYDLVPVLSFIYLNGRCRYCKKPIGWIYPITELFFAIFFTMALWRFGLSFVQIPLVLSVSLLAVGALRDSREKAVELTIFLVGIPLALTWSLFQNGFSWSNVWVLLLVMVIAALLPSIFAVFSRQKWMGYGDILFALWAGVLAGYPGVLVALFSAFLCGSLFGILQIVTGRAKAKSAIPFGPFLALGSMVGLFFGQDIFNLYLKLLGL